MKAIHEGRWTARIDEPHVVFLIGMRFNKFWKVWSWLPVFLAMPRMIRELEAKPELGYLGGASWIGRTIVFVQYWRSFEALENYAKARDSIHLPAWAAFNRAIGSNGDVGIYHETYQIAPGTYENIYINMPPTLFGAVAPLAEVSGRQASARGRIEANAARAAYPDVS